MIRELLLDLSGRLFQNCYDYHYHSTGFFGFLFFRVNNDHIKNLLECSKQSQLKYQDDYQNIKIIRIFENICKQTFPSAHRLSAWGQVGAP